MMILYTSLVQADMKPLITASEEGHVRMVELLLANGADANMCDQVCVCVCVCVCCSCHAFDI